MPFQIQRLQSAALIAGVLAAAQSLSGCGDSPPKDADIRTALSAWAQTIGGQTGVDMFKESIAQAKVIACVKSDIGGYNCDFIGLVGPQNARFVKSDSGWVVIMPNK